MLEWIATPYGEMVPKFNGTLLASKVDPFKEARVWVAHNKKQIESANCHFILGVGGGHHVLEAARQFPLQEFIAIEFLESLAVSEMYVQLRTLTNVELIVGEDEKKLFRNERVERALSDLFTIISHTHAQKISPKYYQELQDILVGRNWKSFNRVLKFRTEEELFLNEINFEPKKSLNITAKDIISFVQNKDTELTDSETIWMTLGELIK
jgi:hypothetical protein